MNVDLKLTALYDKLLAEIRAVETIQGEKGDQGEQGIQGPKGEKGDRGEQGNTGPKGKDGRDGVDGKDGQDGQDGVSVVDAEIDVDNHLVLKLSDGSDVDAGSLESLTAVGQQVYASVSAGGITNADETYTWIDYASGFTSTPTFVETIASGDVYSYVYGSTTLYRLVGTSEDSFYRSFSSPTLSGLVISRGLSI